jgi:hypothetical protein
MTKRPTPFKEGDLVIVRKEYRKKKHHPIRVNEVNYTRGITYAEFDSRNTINPYYFILATEEEIKIHKIKNMF